MKPPRRASRSRKLADWVDQNRLAMNMVWLLVTGFLVMFMQAGFALVETGFTRAKNAMHTMTMNFMVYALGMVGYFLVGFAFGFGGIPTVGATNLGSLHTWADDAQHRHRRQTGPDRAARASPPGRSYDVGSSVFLFQLVFMDTAATIPTGAWPSGGVSSRSSSMACSSP